MFRVYSVDFICKFQLFLYPFDEQVTIAVRSKYNAPPSQTFLLRQVCNMSFYNVALDVELKPLWERVESWTKELNEYLLYEFSWEARFKEDVGSYVNIKYDNGVMISGQDHTCLVSLIIRYRLKRRITGVVLNIYIPTALICVLCHSTVYYGEGLFKAVVAVNLTSLLCLITMFNRWNYVDRSNNCVNIVALRLP